MKKPNKFRIFFNWLTNAGTTYYRMMNPAKYMRQAKNVEVAFQPYNPASNQPPEWESQVLVNPTVRNKVLDDLGNFTRIADISVWQMCHNDMSLALFYTMRHCFPDKPILMEMDDYAFNVNTESYASEAYHAGSINEDIVKRQIQNSSGMIVTTQYLKEKYSLFNKNIHIVPNGIDFEIWDTLKNNNNKDRVRIGWSGGQAHIKDLKVVCKAIPEVLKQCPNAEFMFYGGYPDRYIEESDRVKFHKNKGVAVWTPIDRYPQELAMLGFDIGLAPLRDNEFNRAKSNLRWLEYSALKIPTIASPVGEFLNVPKPIFYARDVDDWVKTIVGLVKSKTLREVTGKKSYDNAKRLYNVKDIAELYLNTLKNFCKTDFKKDIIFESHREKMFPEVEDDGQCSRTYC